MSSTREDEIQATLKEILEKQAVGFAELKAELKAEIQGLKEELAIKDTKIAALESTVKNQGVEITRLKDIIQNAVPQSTDSPKEIVDLLLAGDSIIGHVEVNPLNPGGNNLKVCVRGGMIADLRKEIMYLLSKFTIMEILLQLGSNNTESECAAHIAFQLATLAEEIKKGSPETQVYIGDVLPRRINQNENTDFEIFRQIHRKLRGASKSGHFDLIVNYQFWRKDEDKYVQNFKLFSRRDYVHLNFKGVELLSKNFAARLSSCRVQQYDVHTSSDYPNLPPNETSAANTEETVTTTATSSGTPGLQNVLNDVYIPPLAITFDPI